MEARCKRCSELIDSELNVCPNCGEPVVSVINDKIQFPDSIDSLISFVEKNNVDLKKLNFYINEDSQNEGAYVIKQGQELEYIVYRLRTDKTQHIIYKGFNEYDAVNCFYKKLYSHMFEVNVKPEDIENNVIKNKKNIKESFFFQNKILSLIAAILCVGLISGGVFLFYKIAHRNSTREKQGYYNYFGKIYYHDDDGWFEADNGYWYVANRNDAFFLFSEKYFSEDYMGDEFSPDKVKEREETTEYDWDSIGENTESSDSSNEEDSDDAASEEDNEENYDY